VARGVVGVGSASAARSEAGVSNPQSAGLMQVESPSTPAANASEGAAGPKRWHFVLPIGVWPFGMEGEVGIAGYATDVDLSGSDVQDLNTLALGFAFEAGYDKWTALPNLAFLRFENDPTYRTLPGGTVVYGNPRLEWFTAELAFAYRAVLLNPGPQMFVLEPLAGVRYTELTASIHEEEESGIDFQDRSVDWTDPFVGFRAVKSFTPHIGSSLRADVGGGGSNLTWNASVGLGYRFPFKSSALTVALGYKANGVDYESDDQGKFMMDMTMSGPTLGLAYSF